MKITKSILKQIIKEEILKEVYSPPLTPVGLTFDEDKLAELETAFAKRDKGDPDTAKRTKAFMETLKNSREFAVLNPELNNEFLQKLIDYIKPKPDQEPVASAEEKEE